MWIGHNALVQFRVVIFDYYNDVRMAFVVEPFDDRAGYAFEFFLLFFCEYHNATMVSELVFRRQPSSFISNPDDCEPPTEIYLQWN